MSQLILECGSDFSIENLLLKSLISDNGDGTFTLVGFGSTSTIAELASLIAAVVADYTAAKGIDAVTPSNTVDLAHPGWFEVRGAAGTVKFDPVKGAAGQTLTFAQFELSKMQVKRIYTTGTTATTIVVYYP
jgi:hypothetical protein